MPSLILSDNGVSSGSAGLKTTAASDGALALQTSTAGGAATTAVTIDTSQNVGIGTSSPSSALQVGDANTSGKGITLRNGGGASRTAYITTIGTTAASADQTWYSGVNVFASNGSYEIKNAAGNGLILDTSANLGLGVTPSAWLSTWKALQLSNRTSLTEVAGITFLGNNFFQNSSSQNIYLQTGFATLYSQNAGQHNWQTAPSGTAGAVATLTQAMTLDASGNLLVGVTSQPSGLYRLVSSTNGTGATGGALFISNQSTVGNEPFSAWHTATSGDNIFCYFGTEAAFTVRGTISYNRGAGLVAYNVTSDYRAKDIYGPVIDSGSVIDSTPVYMGKMKGATQERPMFIAHETPDYAHTGEKDAVDKDGNPVYQQMDTSALVPVLWAEIQSLRKRLAAAGI